MRARPCLVLLLAAAASLSAGCEERKPSATLPPKEAAPSPAPTAAEAASERAVPPVSAGQKLDSQLVLALSQSRGKRPFDQPDASPPDLPIRDGDRVLIDLEATVSQELLNHLARIGGRVVSSPDPAHTIRAMLPLSQVEGLASRADIKSIAPARLTLSRGTQAGPPPQTDRASTKP